MSSEDQGDMASSDQEDEDTEFDFEPAAENLTGNTDESPLSADAGEEETLPEPEDRVPEEYPAGGDPMKVALERQPLEDHVEDLIGGHIGNQIENQAADGQQEKLELTEADRRLLEEELSLDIDDDASTDATDDRDAAAPAGQPLDDTIDPGSLHRAEAAKLQTPKMSRRHRPQRPLSRTLQKRPAEGCPKPLISTSMRPPKTTKRRKASHR